MEVQIITPDSTLFNGEASLVVVPGIDGQIGILNNHAPLVSSLVTVSYTHLTLPTSPKG